MWKLRRELTVGLPCAQCRHLRSGDCRHPAVQSYSSDPISGEIVAHPAPALAARSEEGSCGPEAALFDPKPSWIAGAFGFVSGLKTALVICAGVFFVWFWMTYWLISGWKK